MTNKFEENNKYENKIKKFAFKLCITFITY